jgi:ketosteroid isomerase-like protein
VYHAAVRKVVRRAFAAVSQGDYERVVAAFDDQAALTFAGDHELAGTFKGREAIRDWFERVFRFFPDLKLEPDAILVEGFPWDTRVATRFRARATLPGGSPYQNEGVQLLRLRWGRVLEERLYEDTQAVAKAIQALARSGS